MAKEKEPKQVEIRDINDTEDIIKKAKRRKYHIFYGNDPRLEVIKIPFDIPAIDTVLGGGLPLGRTVLVVGNFGSGKTFFAQLAIANFQRKGYSVAYVDTERRYDPEWFTLTGIDINKLFVAQPDSGENALDMCVFLVEQKIGLVVMDSAAALAPTVELEGGMEDSNVAALARLLNKGLRKVTSLNIADEDLIYKGTSFIIVNQIRSGIGPYTSYSLPGGQGQQYFSSIILRVMRGSFIEDEGKKKIGFTMKFHTEKNNLAMWPQECQLPFNFTGKLDTVGGLLEMALDLNIVKQAGPYYFYKDEEHKIMGKQAMVEKLKSNKEMFEAIKAEIYNR